MDDPIRTEMMKHRLVSVAEEMGARLQRAAFSPNIKERCDFSCAVFDASGNLVAQAAHIPVHLGAMPLSVQACLESLTLAPGDVAMVNDPYRGGTHLPDLTVVSPVFVEDTSPPTLLGLVANRAHHADIGGMSAGSMPLSQEIFQEGLIIPPVKLMVGHKKNDDIWRMLLANVRTPEERMGDLQAQLAANQIGGERMRAMAERFGAQPLLAEMDALLRYSERMTRQLISTVPNGCYRFEDTLDNDGFTKKPAVIRVAIMIEDDQATVDFLEPIRNGLVASTPSIRLRCPQWPMCSDVCWVWISLPIADVCGRFRSTRRKAHWSTPDVPPRWRPEMSKPPSELWMFSWEPWRKPVLIAFRRPARAQ